MSDVSYIVAGFVLTFVTIVGYATSLRSRIRRTERLGTTEAAVHVEWSA
jgi:hypothetical protein